MSSKINSVFLVCVVSITCVCLSSSEFEDVHVCSKHCKKGFSRDH